MAPMSADLIYGLWLGGCAAFFVFGCVLFVSVRAFLNLFLSWLFKGMS